MRFTSIYAPRIVGSLSAPMELQIRHRQPYIHHRLAARLLVNHLVLAHVKSWYSTGWQQFFQVLDMDLHYQQDAYPQNNRDQL